MLYTKFKGHTASYRPIFFPLQFKPPMPLIEVEKNKVP